MKRTRKNLVVCVVAVVAIFLNNFGNVRATEDEYEDDHEDNVVEHPGPTLNPSPGIEEVEEKVIPAAIADVGEEEEQSVPFIISSDSNEEEDIIQTTTYPIFDEPLTSTTIQNLRFPPTTTTTLASVLDMASSTPLPELESSSSSLLPSSTTTATTSTSTEGSLPSSSSTSSPVMPVTTVKTFRNVPFLPPHQRPVRSDLASMPLPKGEQILIGNLTIYESPISNETFDGVMLISVHDIFGFHPHVKYISDRLAEFGFRTIVPDFFHGKPVALENFPPPNFTETARFLFNKDGFWEPVRADLLSAMNYYKETANITSFGMYGFCWGGKMIIYASADKNFTGINAIGLVHPSRVVTQDANEINAPAILLPSNAEADMIPFFQILEKRFGDGKSEHVRYDDMRHGFAGATSDFSNPMVRTRVEEAIDKLGAYFRKTLV